MKYNLTINLAREEYGNDLSIDLAATRHLLVAGATGSGKSVLLHNIVSTLLTNNSPEDLKMILIDSKRVELTMYEDIPHLLTPPIIEPKRAVLALKWSAKEIERRYDILNKAGYKNISEYRGSERMPGIVIAIDEFSDLMQTYPRETEPVVLKLARIGHPVGVYIIVSTSRPSTRIYTKSILDAIPARIALQVSSAQDSKTMIGTSDALMLRGSGDMLFRDGLKYAVRGQARFVSETDVKAQCKALCDSHENYTGPKSVLALESSADGEHDDLYDLAKEATIEARTVSTSYLQRKFGVGYSRAAKLMDMLEEKGVIGPANGSKPREVLGV